MRAFDPLSPRPPWWRESWVPLAFVVAVLQITVFWLVSPKRPEPKPVRPPAKNVFVSSDEASPSGDEWLWLLTPSILIQPSLRDFSGAAWLAGTPMQVEFAQLNVRDRRLPYVDAASVSSPQPLLPRAERGLASTWSVPPSELAIPTVVPVPLPAHTTLRVERGLEGWQVPANLALPPAPEGPIPGSTVLRIAVGSQGDVALPPLVWEASGNAAADELAIRRVTEIRFEPGGERQLMSESAAVPVVWGLVRLEWLPARPAPTLAGVAP